MVAMLDDAAIKTNVKFFADCHPTWPPRSFWSGCNQEQRNNDLHDHKNGE